MDLSISVILPNYNHGKYVARAVEALLSQDLAPKEIIIIDDGSTDDSLEAIGKLERTSPIIQVLRNRENKGLVPSQNRGLFICSGRYVYLAASDDWTFPGFFSFAVEMLAKYPEAGLFCGEVAQLDGIDGHLIGFRPVVVPSFSATWIRAAQARRLFARGDNRIITGASLIRRDILISAGGLVEELGSFADGYLVRKIALTHGFCFAPRLVVTWSIFPEGASRKTSLDTQRAIKLMTVASARMSADLGFPSWYASRFGGTWRFATSRLALQTNDKPLLFAFVEKSSAEGRFLGLLWCSTGGRLRRLTILIWLWLRLRPYRLSELVATSIFRHFLSYKLPGQMDRLSNS